MHSTFGGCGYVGQQVACHEIADGGDVCALVRTVDSVAQLADLGITSRQVDFDQDVPVLALQPAPGPTADPGHRAKVVVQTSTTPGR
jgi:nucleoside-diphosphate-sugar epimerase